ncbi:hypothetical protein F0U59_23330 [Archangium gephyra]|nr:hypothetical protein F0U59_23330 [Archangium gephyra]
MSSHGLPRRFVLNVTTSEHGAVVLAVAVSGPKCVAEAGGLDLQAALADALAGMRAASRRREAQPLRSSPLALRARRGRKGGAR